MQTSIFPVDIVDMEPFNGNTARLKQVGYDAAGRKYAIKQTSDCPDGVIPINEWFAYHLCRVLGIPTPMFEVVTVGNDVAFGSVWEDNVKIYSPANHNPAELLDAIAEAKLSINRIIPQDCFLANPDRHFGNMIFKTINGKITALAFDWSETIGLKNTFSQLNPANTNTLKSKTLMSNLHSLKKTFDIEIDKIAAIKPDIIENILNSAPKAWLKNIDTIGIIDFWKNSLPNYAETVKKQ